MKTKCSHGVMLLRNLDGAALCALTCCEHHLCWFVKQKDAFFPGSRPQCVFVQQSMEECVYHCEPPSDKRYHTHSGPFPVLYVTAAGHDEKPSCEHGLFINFPGRHLISPPLEAVGGKKKILDIAALHRKSMLLSRMLEAPPGHEDGESSLKCWTGFSAAGLLFDFLQRQEMWAGFPSVFSQLNCYVRAAPPAGQTHMFQGNIQPAASLRRGKLIQWYHLHAARMLILKRHQLEH